MEVVIHTSMILFFMYRLDRKLVYHSGDCRSLVAVAAIIPGKPAGKGFEEISEENAALLR